MKKLISVFAALALVGSLAAQKKAAAKPAPAKPVVTAPAVPAVPTTVQSAMAMAPASHDTGKKGVGLFIEGRGTFTLTNGTASSQLNGDGSGGTSFLLNGTTYFVGTYKLPNPTGFGGGATIGYEIAQGLGLVASFDYRSINSVKWSQSNLSTLGGAGSSQTIQNTTNTSVLGIGFRPSMHALGGKIYGGMGFAYVLPFNSTTQVDFTTAGGVVGSNKAVSNLNAGIGAYGELGYNYSITDNIYLGLGFRILVATANNDGKTVETTSTIGGVTTVTTVNYSATTTQVDATHLPYFSTGITDISANINIGVRF